MTFELYTTGRVIEKIRESGLFGPRYTVVFETYVEEQRVRGIKKVGFDEYFDLDVGNEVDVKLFSGDGRTITASRIDAGLESLFGAFVHPSLKEKK